MAKEYPHETPLPENVVLHPERGGMPLPVVDILRAAYNAELADCVIVGRKENGREYFCMSGTDMGDVMYLLQRGLNLMNHVADDIQAGIDDDRPNPSV